MLSKGHPLYFTDDPRTLESLAPSFSIQVRVHPFSVIGAILRQDPYIGGSTGKEASQAFLLKWRAILFGEF